MDTPIIPHTIVTPHPTLITSPAGITHATPWTGTGFTPANAATQHKDTNPGSSSNVQGPQPPIIATTPKTVTIQDFHPDSSWDSDSDSDPLNY